MIYLRLIVLIAVVLFLVYTALVIGQLFGLWQFTRKEIKASKIFIPFYYWFNL